MPEETNNSESSDSKVEQADATSNQTSSDTETKAKSGGGVKILLIILGVVVLLCACCGIGWWVLTTFFAEELSETFLEEYIETGLEQSSDGEVDIDIDADEGSFTWESEDGSGSMNVVEEWPEDMPSDVPHFDYGVIDGSVSWSDDTGGSWSVTYTDIDSGAVDSYKTDLESVGFDIVSSFNTNETEMITAEKGSISVSLTCDTANDSCVVSVGEME